jgi:hypothetical protein
MFATFMTYVAGYCAVALVAAALLIAWSKR